MTTKTTAIRKVNLAEAFARITDHWNPRVAGNLRNNRTVDTPGRI